MKTNSILLTCTKIIKQMNRNDGISENIVSKLNQHSYKVKMNVKSVAEKMIREIEVKN